MRLSHTDFSSALQDLFGAAYPSFPYRAPAWHAQPVPGMGFAMYHPTMVCQYLMS